MLTTILIWVALVIGLIWYMADRHRKAEERAKWLAAKRLAAETEPEPTPRTFDNIGAPTPRQRSNPHAHRQPGPLAYRIAYTDADGNATVRDIALYKSGHTNDRFEAWCGYRQERRSFIFQRVGTVVELETGEMLTNADLFARVHPNRRVPDSLGL